MPQTVPNRPTNGEIGRWLPDSRYHGPFDDLLRRPTLQAEAGTFFNTFVIVAAFCSSSSFCASLSKCRLKLLLPNQQRYRWPGLRNALQPAVAAALKTTLLIEELHALTEEDCPVTTEAKISPIITHLTTISASDTYPRRRGPSALNYYPLCIPGRKSQNLCIIISKRRRIDSVLITICILPYLCFLFLAFTRKKVTSTPFAKIFCFMPILQMRPRIFMLV